MTSSLPLHSSPPLPSPHCLYVRLLPLAYLAVCAGDKDGEVEDRYFLVEVAESSVPKAEEGGRPPVPRIFHSVVTMAELDNCQLVHDSLRSVAGDVMYISCNLCRYHVISHLLVKRSPAVLKRKVGSQVCLCLCELCRPSSTTASMWRPQPPQHKKSVCCW